MSTTVPAASSEPSSGLTVRAAYGLMGLWGAYLLLAPTTGFSWIESWHNEQRAVQIVLLAATALATAILLIASPDAVRARLLLPLWWWIFVALGSLSACFAPFVFAAFAEVGLFVLLSMLVALVAALTAQRPEQMSRLARYAALLIAIAHVLAVLVRYGASLHIGKGLDLSVFMLGYANPRFASALYAVLMPFVATVATDARERRALRVSAFLALSLLWTINLGLGTRGIWFAYVLAVPALMLFGGVLRPLRLITSIGISALVGLLIFLVLTNVNSGPAGPTAGVTLPIERLQTLTSRDVLWSLAWQAIVQHPLLGLGPMHFSELKSYVGAHPHNWPLQIAAEWGMPALAVLAFVLARTMIRVRSAWRSGAGVNTEALLAALVALVYGLVDGNLLMPVSQSAAALALGVALGSMNSSSVEDGGRHGPSATAAVAAIGALIVLGYAASSLGEQIDTTARFRAMYPGEWLVPRFWEQGLLLNAGLSTPVR